MVYNTLDVPESALTDTEKNFNKEVDTVYNKINQCLDLLSHEKVDDKIRFSITSVLEQYKVNLVKMKYSIAQIDENLQKSYIASFKNLFDSIKAKTEEYLRYCTKVTSTLSTNANSKNYIDILVNQVELYYLVSSS